MSEQSIDRRGPGMAAASLILGVFGLMLVWIPLFGMIAWILSPLGLVLGLVAMGNPAGRGVAIAGVTCSAIGLLACIGWAMLFSFSVSI
ncbi:hypothetical protein [Caulobacter sp. NIBR1757]|uniref:hypothetical protein n=1 Tax=Caulobacter sp. NIBR1757 TaxID=3016000 RepID=UPI0022F14585|nr:hypothetical protein [Caulobacter sp. NIBR1757]WGM38098.1 hypothetical protein AMEJIAPC_00999 [Caulobacter sp. NIBR1757]